MGWAIALHGDAGDIPLSLPAEERRQSREEAVRHCLQIGVEVLRAKMPPLDVVELVVPELEHIPLFNVGRDSVLTNKGTVEMEDSITDGKTKKCGAVSGLKTVVNAISLARLAMERTPHIYLAFDGAEQFAKKQGVPVDTKGNLAFATSTGGLMNKMVGRTGDSPVIGASTYANELCAVSTTGKGEAILHATVARDVASLMEFKGVSLKEAANCVVHERTPKGIVGLVAVSAAGEVAMPYNTLGMLRHVLLKMDIQRLQFGLLPRFFCLTETYLFSMLNLFQINIFLFKFNHLIVIRYFASSI